MTPGGMLALASFLEAMKPDAALAGRSARALVEVPPGAAQATPAATEDAGARAPALSAVAQLISRLAADIPQPALASPSLPAAILPALPDAGTELPEALKDAISRSGLFYESHLEDWISGRMPVSELRLEPQARLPLAAMQALPAAPATQETWQLPRELEPMVREQLNALAQGSASVPVVPWPGQHATITVRDGEPGETPAPPPACRLELKIDLPRLGAVEFVLAAHGDGIRITAHAGQSDSRQALSARADELRDALAARSLDLLSLQVGERGL